MITAGIDVGASSTKAVIMDGNKILAKFRQMAEGEEEYVINAALHGAIDAAGIKREDIGKIVATGAGAKNVDFADDIVTDISSGARGAVYEVPASRTVVDVGAEQARAVKCDATGKLLDFATNERCAAGSGAFIESMARALQTDFVTFIDYHFQSDKDIPLNAQCAVFAESEVVSLINSTATTADISRAINNSIAERTSSMTRRVGIEETVTAIGGVALNKGFLDSLQRFLEVKVTVPADPIFTNAVGAALIAQG
ncbi:putative Activator of lactoyl-CoA dehydratase [uncultured Desulfobacterium sp.]|uniref:Putative Activator of lactoyl-CoA dehydratase n=1 Tax=uncultured Desulfobacterium sp. TaxID=201089 RepID=A0A445MRL6_9BACT|nr:putative Activator of lactoyl-CoA dehydratase [uncultured Desulfobacterium sp.]